MTSRTINTAVTETEDGVAGYTLASGESLFVTPSGSISALGAGPQAYGLLVDGAAGKALIAGAVFSAWSDGVHVTAHNAVLENTGFILGDVAAGDAASQVTVYNAGTLSGNVRLSGGRDGLTNSGLINGSIDMKAGLDILSNDGVIRGVVSLGDGPDVLDNRDGKIAPGLIVAGLRVCSAHGDGGGDIMLGGAQADWFTGDEGADTLAGGGGDDVLDGGPGCDLIHGGPGDDTLIGGPGADTLEGGPEQDLFLLTAIEDSPRDDPDLIIGLDVKGDMIDLSAIDANPKVRGDQAFRRVEAFDGQPGQLVVTYDTETRITLIQADRNGDGKADLVIQVQGDLRGFDNFLL